METLAFRGLPLAVKIAVGVVFYNAWWSIEEFVIDRRGLWRAVVPRTRPERA